MSDEAWLGRVYRHLFSSAPVRSLIAHAVSEERLRAGYAVPRSYTGGNGRRVWFHAASVGELESLWPVTLRWATSGGELIVTVFSESAKSALNRLSDELRHAGDGRRLLFSGYSPLEGAWRTAVEAFHPDLFVTSKYECWPDLWAALAEARTPLVVVGAKPRSSLRVAARASRWLQGRKPNLHFLCANAEDGNALEAEFAGSRAVICGDPRWDRVRDRVGKGSPRVRAIVEQLGDLPRPWGVLGSAWISDIKIWSRSLSEVRGTLWVVPHRVDLEALREIETFLESSGRKSIRSSQIGTNQADALNARTPNAAPAGDRATVLVDEMGFLLELYGPADWAYVGGGFEAGVHSTIEPAIRGIPICAGPKRADRFPEIAELVGEGQLTLVSDAFALERWLTSRQLLSRTTLGANGESRTTLGPEGEAERARWLRNAEDRSGASDEVVRAIEQVLHFVSPPGPC